MSYPDPAFKCALSLHVIGAGPEGHRTVPLGSGLSIGSDARNSIVIDHPDVRPIHATVWGSAEVGLQLECAEGAAAWLSDGTEIARLNLVEGARCRIGDTLLICTDTAGGDDANAGDDGYCARCALDLQNLPRSRCFCPRCGLRLGAPSSAAGAIRHRPQRALPVDGRHEPDHTPVIAGYATAMNKLGVRYEHGQGVVRNEDEAFRCYGKAARLGNGDARTRLQQPDESRAAQHEP